MEKAAGFIVKARAFFLVLFIAMAGVCAYLSQGVNVNYDMTHYLPADSPTSIALNVMKDEFGNIGYLQTMVKNVSTDEAAEIADRVKELPGVNAVIFDDTDLNYYRDGNALIKVYLDYNDFSEEATGVIEDVKAELSDYDISLSGYAVESGFNRDMIKYDMRLILLMCFGVVMAILLLTSLSWADPAVFACGIGVALLLNLGTNSFLPSISFVSNAICAVLQLALAMDYSIIVLHRYDEERSRTDDKCVAMRKALSASILSVSASSLTTIAGLCALMVMRFTIGLDIGLVLAKGIVCSLLTGFLFLPAVILLFDPLLQKTKHRPFLPKMDGVARFAIKARKIVPFAALLLFVLAFFIQRDMGLIYEIEINKKSEVYADRAEIDSAFGYQNPLVVLVPKGDTAREQSVIDYIKSLEYNGRRLISDGQGLANTELNDWLTIEEAAERYDSSVEDLESVYADITKRGLADGELVRVWDLLEYLQTSSYVSDRAEERQENAREQRKDVDELYTGLRAADMAARYDISPDVTNALWRDMGYDPENYVWLDIALNYAHNNSFFTAYAETQALDTEAKLESARLLEQALTINEAAEKYGIEPKQAAGVMYALHGNTLGADAVIPAATLYGALYQQTGDIKYGQLAQQAQQTGATVTMAQAMAGAGMDEQTAFVLFAISGAEPTPSVTTAELITYLYEQQGVESLSEKYASMQEATAPLDKAGIMAESYVFDDAKAQAALDYYGSDTITGVQLLEYTVSNDLIRAFGKDGQLRLDDKFYASLEASEVMTREDVAEQYGIEDKWIDEIYDFYGNPETLTKAQLVTYVTDNDLAIAIGEDKISEVGNNWDDANYATEKFEGEHYSRLVFNVNAEIVSDESFWVTEQTRETLGEYYDEYYILGAAVNIYDIRDTFSKDVTLVNIVNVIAIFLIVMLSFRSVSIPLVLVACIQGAIFVNFSINTLTDSPVYFVCYLIAICIQLGATIDYGILLTDRYCHYRLTKSRDEAILKALGGSISTILTSGLILIIAAFIVGFASSVPIISYIGKLISQGAVVSVIVVLFVLPSCLCLLDRFIEKGSMKRTFFHGEKDEI